MKTGKKLSSLILSLLLVMAMAIPAFAVDTVRVTINGGGNNAVFSAYKLLDAKLKGAELTDGVSYAVNPKYRPILKTVTNKTASPDSINDLEIIKYIADLQGKAEDMRTFSEAVLSEIKKQPTTYAADATSNNKEFAALEKGYYLIYESTVGDDNVESLVIVKTVGKEITINSKDANVTIPTIEKKVKEKNDTTGTQTTWQDAADYDVEDFVPFQLKVTLPNNIDNFKKYKFEIKDQFAEGFTFDQADIAKADFKITKETEDGTDVKANFKTTYDGSSRTLTIVPKKDTDTEIDLKELYKIDDTLKGKAIYITYRAKLNTSAVIGKNGNINEAWVVYSKSQISEDGEPTTTTAKDKVKVFTYKFIVEKHDESGNKALGGAEFKLYKKDLSHTGNDDETSPGETNWKEVTLVKSGDQNHIFTAERIDAGQYRLVETKAPNGYNAIAPIIFTITATYDTDSADPQLTALTGSYTGGATGNASVDGQLSQLSTKVVNQKGVELPETGGMGTTILYLFGAVLSFGTGIVLVSKKRMKINK